MMLILTNMPWKQKHDGYAILCILLAVLAVIAFLLPGCKKRLTSQKQIVYICEDASRAGFTCRRHGPQGFIIESRSLRAVVLMTPEKNNSNYIITLLILPHPKIQAANVEAQVMLASQREGADPASLGASKARSPIIAHTKSCHAIAGGVVESWLGKFIAHPALNPHRDPEIDVCIAVIFNDNHGNTTKETLCFVAIAEEITIPASLI